MADIKIDDNSVYPGTDLCRIVGIPVHRLYVGERLGHIKPVGTKPYVRRGFASKKRNVKLYSGRDFRNFYDLHVRHHGDRSKLIVRLPVSLPDDGLPAMIERILIEAMASGWGGDRPFFRKQNNGTEARKYVALMVSADLERWLRGFGSMSAAVAAILQDKGVIQ